jgi:hypothetical protein
MTGSEYLKGFLYDLGLFPLFFALFPPPAGNTAEFARYAAQFTAFTSILFQYVLAVFSQSLSFGLDILTIFPEGLDSTSHAPRTGLLQLNTLSQIPLIC